LHKTSGHIVKLLDSVSLTRSLAWGTTGAKLSSLPFLSLRLNIPRGSGLLADFGNRHQKYLAAAVFVATPYIPPASYDLGE
jgi:hypothetical protein